MTSIMNQLFSLLVVLAAAYLVYLIYRLVALLINAPAGSLTDALNSVETPQSDGHLWRSETRRRRSSDWRSSSDDW